MEIRVRATGAVMFENEWRQWLLANGGPSFEQLTPEIMEELGADPVFEGPQATTTPPYQYSMRSGVEQIDGKWYTKYIAGPLFADYTDGEGVVHTAAEQEAAYKARKDSEQATSVRQTRNEKLAMTDWTQARDVVLANDAEWATYRQALRDISSQPGFPWAVIWPKEPK